MPKQTGIPLEGTFQGTIYYKRKGLPVMREKGKTGNQGPATKAHSALLGKASGMSARIRKALAPILPEPGNRKLMYRLNFAILQWLRTGQYKSNERAENIPFIQGFSFHNTDEVKNFDVAMTVSRVDNGFILHVPVFDSPNPIYPLPFSGQVHLHAMAVSCSLNDAETKIAESISDILYNGTPLPPQQIYLPLETEKDTLTIVALSINKHVAGVVGAFLG